MIQQVSELVNPPLDPYSSSCLISSTVNQGESLVPYVSLETLPGEDKDPSPSDVCGIGLPFMFGYRFRNHSTVWLQRTLSQYDKMLSTLISQYVIFVVVVNFKCQGDREVR